MTWTSSRTRSVLMAAVLSLAGCGGERAPVEPLPLEKIEEVAFHESLGVDLGAMQVTENGVYWRDLEVGDGTLAEPGVEVRFTYLGRYRNGQTFDTSDRSGALVFTIGDGFTIDGFDEGVRGMREGGRRQLVIPPELAYGQGGPAGILVFDVVLLSATTP